MILPLGDEPNPRGVPIVNYALIAVNCITYALITLPLSFVRPDLDDPALAEYLRAIAGSLPRGISMRDVLAQVSAYDLFVFEHGFRPAEPAAVALISSMFLHAGLMHLVGNMLFLWIYGDNVEHRLGRIPYLLAYLATGVAATLFHTLFDSESQLPLVGASGAISGVLGFYFLWFPHNRVRLWVMFFPIMMNVIYMPARLVLGMYLLIDNLLPFLVTRGLQGGGVAYGAHIGGFLGGLAVAWQMNRRRVSAPPREYRAAATLEPLAESASDPIARLLDEGRVEEAATMYFRLAPERTRRLLSPERSIEIGRWLANRGHADAALVLFQRHLRDYPTGPLAAEAHLGAGLLQLHAFDQPAAAYQHLVEVFDFDPLPQTAALAREALGEITAHQKYRVRTQP